MYLLINGQIALYHFYSLFFFQSFLQVGQFLTLPLNRAVINAYQCCKILYNEWENTRAQYIKTD